MSFTEGKNTAEGVRGAWGGSAGLCSSEERRLRSCGKVRGYVARSS
jgi:hypothetical protein